MENGSRSAQRHTLKAALSALGIVAVVAMASFTGCSSGDSSTNNSMTGSDAMTGSDSMTGSEGGDSSTCSNTQTDPMNCGSCGHACKAREVCSAGMCASMCGAGSTQCGQSCVELQNDNANCGACGNACKMGEVCSQGKCGTNCGGGTTLCSMTCVDTKVDPDNCGGCGMKCAAGKSCVAGACISICGNGQTFCADDAGSGYCANENTDNANCGACGNVCGNGQVCSGGSCQNGCIGADGGVETLCSPEGGAPYCADLNNDNANCGACGTVCGQGQTCETGACTNACISPDGGVETLCSPEGGTPYCANTDSDNQNCGACGTVCGQGQVCSAGVCGTNCQANEMLCMGDGGNYCANTQTDNANCGSCGNVCGNGQACSGGTCVTNCGGSDTLCMGDAGNYCANLNSDNQNCGACGTACVNGEYCSNGVCKTALQTCKVVNGLQWCFNNLACGQACTAVCQSLGLTVMSDTTTWFNAQNTSQLCTNIATAFGMASIQFNSWSYACLEDSGGGDTLGGGLLGSLFCSSYSGCPTAHLTTMDQGGVACGAGARRSICPCQ